MYERDIILFNARTLYFYQHLCLYVFMSSIARPTFLFCVYFQCMQKMTIKIIIIIIIIITCDINNIIYKIMFNNVSIVYVYI